MVKLTPPLKWHGGKHYLASWIISHMPPHLHYVEPYFGGGAVLLARNPNRDWMSESDSGRLPSSLRGCSEVVNDLHGHLINFWRVLADKAKLETLQQLLSCTPFCSSTWEESLELMSSADEIEAAAAFFVLARQSRQGLCRDFATLSRTRTRRGMNEQVSSWLTAIDGLADVHRRLQTVVILNQDAISVIQKQDGERSLFYCDPPYVAETRVATDTYEFEMTLDDHRSLLECLSHIEGKFMLSGYRCELYDQYAEANGWRVETKLIDNKASGAKTKESKTECLWMNF